MSKDYRVLAIAALADELLKSGERQAAKLLLTEAVEPLLKSREDDFVVDIGRVAREVALAKGLTFEHEYVLRGAIRNHVFKIGTAEVEYAKLGREIKVDLRCTSESDPKSVALAKAVVNKIRNTYAQMGEVLSKARVSQNRSQDGKFSYDGNHDRECAGCGREFGKHLAGPPHLAKGCDGFRPLTKSLEKAKIDDVRHGKTGHSPAATEEEHSRIRAKRSRRNSRHLREWIQVPGSDRNTYHGVPSHHGWDNANLGGPVDPLAYGGRYRTSYRSRVKDNPTPNLPGGKVSGTYPEEADDVKKGDVTSIIGRKRKEDPPTSEGKTIGTLLPPEAHREAGEHHVQHLMHHNEASQNALQAADRAWLKGDEASRNKNLATSANHEGHAEKHYEHALSHAKRFGEGKHWVAFVQGLQAPANPSSDKWHQFNPHPHDSALAGRLVDPKKLTKAKIDDVHHGKTGQHGDDRHLDTASGKYEDRRSSRVRTRDFYSERVPMAINSGIPSSDRNFQRRRLRQTQNLPNPKLTGGKVSGTYPEEADVEKAKIDTYHFGETGRGGPDVGDSKANSKARYRSRRQFRDVRGPAQNSNWQGHPDFHGTLGQSLGQQEFMGEPKDPLHHGAMDVGITAPRTRNIKKPNLPKGHDRSHPDYLGTNVDKSINPLALAALAKAIKRAPRNKRALGRKKKTKGVWATGGSSKKPPLKGQHVSGRTVADQSVGTGGSSIAGILGRILGG